MKLTQHFHGTVGNVYNIEGDLILSPRSDANDFSKVLAELKLRISSDEAIEATARDKAVAQMDAAVSEARSNKPEGKSIESFLSRAARILEASTKTATSALDAVKIINEIAKWAGAML